MRRATHLLLLTLLLWLPAGAAHADPAGPTNYDSRITDAPDTPGVTFDVFGGDAFITVTVEPGHEVLVYGYDNEERTQDPYLRVLDDGTVEINRRSPARWKNEDRFAAVETPDFVDPAAPADWEVVASGGSYAWHDHRIHWMSPALPPTIDPDGGVQVVPSHEQWSIPVVIDGQDVEVFGTLSWQPPVSPVPWIGIALVVLAVVAVIARRNAREAMLTVGLVGILALIAGIGASFGLPAGVGIIVPVLLLPAVTILAVAVGLRRPEGQQRLLSVLASAPLAVWAIIQFGALTAPIIPSRLSATSLRITLAIVLGSVVGTVIAALLDLFGGDLSDLASLADDEEAGQPAT